MKSNKVFFRKNYIYLRWLGNNYKIQSRQDFYESKCIYVIDKKTNYIRVEEYSLTDADKAITYYMSAIFLPEIQRYLLFGDTFLTEKFYQKYLCINEQIFNNL